MFVCCTRFLRMYFHRVSSRHWPSPLTHQDAARITQGLLLRIIRDSAPPPGFFWLFAIRELVVGVLRRGQGRRDGTRESRCLARADWDDQYSKIILRIQLTSEKERHWPLQRPQRARDMSWLVTGTIGAGLAAFSADRAAARRLAPPGRPGAGATAAGWRSQYV